MARLLKHGIEITAKDKTKEAYKSATSNAKKASNTIKKAFAIGIGGVGVTALVKEIGSAGLEMERYERVLKNVTGSTQAATQEFDFITRTAKNLGLELSSTAQSYSKLLAAAKGTNLEGQASREIFEGVAQAAAVLGLTAEQTGGALTAIEQIISKGKVSAEELRGQLGERLPGAFQIAARAMGKTTEELDKLVSSGKVTAEQLLPALGAELKKTFGPSVPEAADSAQAAINNLKTEIFQLKVAISNSGVLEGVTSLTKGLRGLIIAADFSINGASQGFGAAADRLEKEAQKIREEIQRVKLSGITNTDLSIIILNDEQQERLDALQGNLARLKEAQKAIFDGEEDPRLKKSTNKATLDTERASAELDSLIAKSAELRRIQSLPLEVEVPAHFRENLEILTNQAELQKQFAELYERTRTPLEALNAETEKLTQFKEHLIAAGKDEARVIEAVSRAQNELNEAYARQDDSIMSASEAQETYQDLLEQTRTKEEQLAASQAELLKIKKQLIAAGIEESKVAEVIQRAQKKLTEGYSQQSKEAEKYKQELQFVFQAGIFAGFEDGVDGMVESWAKGLERMLIKALATDLLNALGLGKTSSGGGAGAGNIFSTIGSAFAGLFGFQNGGEFKVGGGGGIDSQLVAFRATPNETVTVTKPGQSGGSQGLVFSPTYNIDARNADATLRQELPIILEQQNNRTKAELLDLMAKGRIPR